MKGMDQLSSGALNFFYFVIPGFVMVWTFRYLSRSKKAGDFEFLGLSVVWGLVSLLIFETYVHFTCLFGAWLGCPGGDPQTAIQQILANPYAFAVLFAFTGLMFGWIGYIVSRAKWAKWVVKKIRITAPAMRRPASKIKKQQFIQ